MNENDFDPRRPKMDSTQRAGLTVGLVGGIAAIPVGMIIVILLLLAGRSSLFGTGVILIGIALIVYSRMIKSRRQ